MDSDLHATFEVIPQLLLGSVQEVSRLEGEVGVVHPDIDHSIGPLGLHAFHSCFQRRARTVRAGCMNFVLGEVEAELGV